MSGAERTFVAILRCKSAIRLDLLNLVPCAMVPILAPSFKTTDWALLLPSLTNLDTCTVFSHLIASFFLPRFGGGDRKCWDRTWFLLCVCWVLTPSISLGVDTYVPSIRFRQPYSNSAYSTTFFNIRFEYFFSFFRLNMPHDDDFKCQQFVESSGVHNVMSRMLDHNTFPWAWSNCSRYFITEYLEWVTHSPTKKNEMK